MKIVQSFRSFKRVICNSKNIAMNISVVFIAMYLSACSSIPNPYSFGEVDEKVALSTAKKELSNQDLLDVSIKIFEPGELPEDEDDRRGLSEEIRNAEARYIPVHLKYTMQRSGYWGNVRVVPDHNEGSEVFIQGSILESDGESIELKIRVSDARNNLWFERTYKETVTFEEIEKKEPQKEDNFQDLYNEIANDITEHRKKLTAKEIGEIKNIAELRFAKFMAPEIFSGYLHTKANNEYEIIRLPSVDDPMLKRVHSIKARDDLLTDTINNYYDIYYSDMWESYDNWRKFRSEEMETIRDIERKALTQKVLGAAAIIGAIALGASSDVEIRDRTGALRTVMIAGGAYALAKGFQTSQETQINKEAIEELGASFSSDVEPMVVQVQGKSVKLTGSAEQQYGKWRNLLKEIYRKETGFY